MPGKTTRSSNLELLRILCMLLIIGDHLTGQSGIADYTTLPSSFAFCLIGCGSRIACSVFVLIGGWFLCEQPYKTRRPLSLWLSLWLYTVPVTLLCKLAGLDVSWGALRWAAFPASTRQLWFISDYLLLLLCVPLLNRLLLEGNEKNVVKSVIIVPTRELAQQIDMQFQGFSYYMPVSTAVIYGGGDGRGWDQQKRGLQMGADVVIATPGRLISHLMNSRVDLSHVDYLILDEADRMLDMGFYDDIMQIVSYMPKSRQTLMFSATLPPKIRQMAKQILNDPAEVNIAISKPNEAIEQGAYICYEGQKLGIVREMFSWPSESKTIIFSSSKQKVKELAHTLKRMKLDVAPMHSDLDQEKREQVMLDFKNNKVRILVATDIVARGIDIEDIGMVINYDVPHDPEDYIHRIGRTARASATGRAVTFVNEEEQGKFHRIEEFIEREIPKLSLPEAVGAGPEYNPAAFSGHGGRRGRSGSGRGGNGRSGGRGRSRGRDGAKSAGPVPAEGVVAAANVESRHGEGRGEGNRGSRDRGRRRNRNRNRNRNKGGDDTPQA